MKKTKVALFFGGHSPEYEVSPKSSYAIINALDYTRFEAILIGITRLGDFKLFNGPIETILDDSWPSYSKPLAINLSTHHPHFICNDETIDFDIAFPILHGVNGEDGTLQGLFELLDIKYVGCNLQASVQGMDKHLTKLILKDAGIMSAEGIVLSPTSDLNDYTHEIERLGFPLFVKPAKAGSSFGISKVYSMDKLHDALDLAFEYDHKIILEKCIDGFEVGCAIMGNNDLIIGEIDEIEIKTDFFNFEEKYSLKSSTIHLPARLDECESTRIKKTALKIYKVLGLSGLSRIDLFYTKDKELIFNEVNTLPGFTSNSRFPNMLKAKGYDFTEIISELLDLGLENHE